MMDAEPKKIYLCKPDTKMYIVLNGVQTPSVELSLKVRDYSTLTFIVDRYIDVDGTLVESNGYEMLHNHMELFIPDIGYFQMQEPTMTNDGKTSEYKTVMAYSCEKEFEDKDYVGLKVNTGESDSLEYLIDGNIDSLGYAKEYITFYNDDPDFSLLNIPLTKVTNWEIDTESINLDPDLASKKLQFSEDNINMYGFLNTSVSQAAECVFLFDFLNRKIKAYSKTVLDNDDIFDTNIFIGLRNLEKSVTVETDENSIQTRLNVAGADDLTVREYNFGDNRIFNIDYYCNTNYMDETLLAKVRAWIAWLNETRNTYGNLSQQMAELQEKMDDIQYRVPSDEDYWKQWDEMDEDLLRENLAYYNSLLTALRVSVDPNPQYDSEGEYIPWEDGQGNIDNDAYLALLYTSENGYGGYYTYYETLNYVIPNIEIAIQNLGVIPDDKQDYVESYETNWELYGIEELKGKKSDFESRLAALINYSRDWSELTDVEKASYSDSSRQYGVAGRDEYLRLYNYIGYTDPPANGTINKRLQQLEAEYQQLQTLHDSVQEQSNLLAQQASIDYSGWGFTDEEKNIINKLFIDTDYTNNNIVTTTITTPSQKVDIEKELFTDAKNKLQELSQPQYRFTADIENLMQLEEFADQIDQLKLLHFIRLGIRDDYFVKMRVIGITYNPCEKDPNIKLEFSNFLTSKHLGRTDITDLLGGSSGASKNSITLGSNTKIDESFATTFLQQLIKSNLFNNKVTTMIQSTNAPVDNAYLSSIISTYIKTSKIDVDKLTGTEAQFETLFTNALSADVIAAKIISADEGTFETLSAKILEAGQATIEELVAESIHAVNIDVTQITGETADFNTLFANKITSNSVITKVINADQGSFDTLTARIVSADNIIAQLAQITQVQAETLFSSNIFTQNIQSIASTTATTVITDAYIQNAIIGRVSVSQLAAGDIALSNSMRILSENGALVMNGTALQIIGTDEHGDPYVGIQLGYDTSSNPSLILKNSEGTTVLTAEGITSDAIADQLIVNNMIQDNTIAKTKLGFTILEPNAQGGIDIANVYDGTQSFGAEYTTFVTNTNNALDDTVVEVKQQYYLSTSSSELIGGQWVYVMPTVTSGTYLWTREEYVTKDNTSTYSDATLGQSTISNVMLQVDANTNSITQKVEQSDIDSSISAYDGTTIQSIRDSMTTYEQTSNGFNWLVSVTYNADQTVREMSFTQDGLTLVNSSLIIKGADGQTTAISGGQIQTDALKSSNYSYTSGNFSSAGTFFNLSDGSIISKNFAINSSGNAYFNGEINADGGTIGGFDISDEILTGTSSDGNYQVFLSSTSSNPALSISQNFSSDPSSPDFKSIFRITYGGILYSDTLDASGNITAQCIINNGNITCTGTLTATNANLTGTVTTSALTATGGTIGGFNISPTRLTGTSSDSLYQVFLSSSTSSPALSIRQNFGTTASPDYKSIFRITYGGVLYSDTLDSSGNITAQCIINNGNISCTGTLTATNANLTGTITTSALTATGGTIGGFDISPTRLTGTDTTNNTQVFLSSSSSSPAISVRKLISSSIGYKPVFRVTYDGIVYSDTLDSSGNITAQTIINNGNVTCTGSLTASNVDITGGTLGGFSISSNRLTGTSADTMSQVFLSAVETSPALCVRKNFGTASSPNYVTITRISYDGSIRFNNLDSSGNIINYTEMNNTGISTWHLNSTRADITQLYATGGTFGSFNIGNSIYVEDPTFFRISPSGYSDASSTVTTDPFVIDILHDYGITTSGALYASSLTTTGNVTASGAMTATGNISSSGDITATGTVTGNKLNGILEAKHITAGNSFTVESSVLYLCIFFHGATTNSSGMYFFRGGATRVYPVLNGSNITITLTSTTFSYTVSSGNPTCYLIRMQ